MQDSRIDAICESISAIHGLVSRLLLRSSMIAISFNRDARLSHPRNLQVYHGHPWPDFPRTLDDQVRSRSSGTHPHHRRQPAGFAARGAGAGGVAADAATLAADLVRLAGAR